jgi:DNA-binding ferritin-like protein (Dps family)
MTLIPKGEKVDGKTFYKFLCADEEFCRHLGRAVLAAGRLETGLKLYLSAHSIQADTERATLGQILGLLEQHALLEKMLPHIDRLKRQRNFLTHNVHAVLSGLKVDDLIGDEVDDLLDSDVDMYAERAWQLAENLNGLADILEKDNSVSALLPGT